MKWLFFYTLKHLRLHIGLIASWVLLAGILGGIYTPGWTGNLKKAVIPAGSSKGVPAHQQQAAAKQTTTKPGPATANQATAVEPFTLDQGPPRLVWLETTLLGATAPNQSLSQRFANLETLVFGSTYPNDPQDKRLTRLESAVKPSYTSTNTPLQPTATPSPASASSNSPTSTAQTASARSSTSQGQPPNTPLSEAPIVDEMEQQAYGQVFAGQPLETRLGRLEKRYLGTIQRGDYASRVDNLRWLVLGGTSTPDALTETGQPYAPPPQVNPYNPYQSQPGGLPPGALASPQPSGGYGMGQQYNSAANPYGNSNPAAAADMANAINRLEQDILKSTYPTEPIPARLGRLEQAVFNQSAEGRGLSDEERLQRLMAVAVAKKDSQSLQRQTGPGGTLRNLWPLIPVLVLMFL